MAEAPPTKKYEVTDVAGVVHKIEATFMFNNAGEVSFRLGERGASDIVAIFPAGQWMNLILKTAQPETEEQTS